MTLMVRCRRGGVLDTEKSTVQRMTFKILSRLKRRTVSNLITLAIVAAISPIALGANQQGAAGDSTKDGDRPRIIVPANRSSTDHVDIIVYATAPEVTPGAAVQLAVDVTPKPGMHVYGPGAKNYKVVSLEIDSVDFVKVDRSRKYPRPETYEFKQFKEVVPIYRRRFRLLREVVVTKRPPAQSVASDQKVTITGRLEYQACTEEICFKAVSVPVSWRFAVGPAI
jgi:uncharacterized protein YdeI (BOF family)